MTDIKINDGQEKLRIRMEQADKKENYALETYCRQYREADPCQIANRAGIPYCFEDHEFQISVLGRAYAVSFPQFSIRCTDGEDWYELSDSIRFKNLLLRFLLFGTVFEANGDFRPVEELPSGEECISFFHENCVRRMENRYGRVLQAFEAIMEKANAVRIFSADIAYELEFLEGLYIRFLFQTAEDGTGSHLQILFSSNFPAAFSVCDLSEIIEICMNAFDAAEPLLAIANPYH